MTSFFKKSQSHIKFLIATCSVVVIVSCTDDENSISFPELIESEITSFTLDVSDSIRLDFTDRFFGFDSAHYVNTVAYFPKLAIVSRDDLAIDFYVDKLENITIWPLELFSSNSTYLLAILVEWYNESGQLVETTTTEYELVIGGSGFPIDQIKATYPIDRQKYFLTAESDLGFLYFDRLPAEAPDLKAYCFDASGQTISTPSLTKNNEQRRMEFTLPQLENESIYSIEIKDGADLVKKIDFRTSKFDSFKDKIANFNLLSNADLVRHKFKNGPNLLLRQEASIAEEGFDYAEVKCDSVKFDDKDEYYHYYSSGLIQLVFSPEGNGWFNDYVQPLIYKPTEDYIYDFTHPIELGDSSFLSVRFEFLSEASQLLDDEIKSGQVDLGFPTSLNIENYVPFATYFEFRDLQYIVVNKFLSDSTIPRSTRVELIINSAFRPPEGGTYKFEMSYRLPDGTITSTSTFDMIYNE